MRKFTLMIVVLVMATVAFAQKREALNVGELKTVESFKAEPTMKRVPAKTVKGTNTKTVKLAKKAPRKAALNLDDLVGESYLGLSFNYTFDEETEDLVVDDVPRSADVVTLTKVDETTLGISGLGGNDGVVNAVVDLETGTLTIEQGQVLGTSSYGNVTLFNLEDDGPITGTIYEDGIVLDQLWCDMVNYQGQDYIWSGIHVTSIVLPNATMSWPDLDVNSGAVGEELSAPVYVSQDEDFSTVIWNFGEFCSAEVTVTEEHTFTIASQFVADGGTQYGEINLYGLTDDMRYLVGTLTGTGTEKELKSSTPWLFYASEGYIFSNSGKGFTVTMNDGEDNIIEYPYVENVAATPAQPAVVNVAEYDASKGYGNIVLDVPATDASGNALKKSLLYYTIYTRIGDVEEKFELTTDEYINLTENITEIPYTLVDGYDFQESGQYKVVFLNHDYSNVDYFGVQSIYYGGDERHESDIKWYRFKMPVVEAPENLETTAYVMTGTISVAEEDENGNATGEYVDEEYTTAVYVGVDGTDFYLQGMCPLLPDAWIKGTIKGTTVTIPSGQYYGKYQTSQSTYNLFFVAKDQETQENCDFVFEYDADADSYLSFNIAGISLTEDAANGLADAIYPMIILNHIEDVPATPSEPSSLTYIPWDEDEEYASLRFILNPVSDEGEYIIPDKLYYQLFSEIQGTQAPVVFTSEYYLLLQTLEMDELPIIPYRLDDNWDFQTRNGIKVVFLNDPAVQTYEKIGVRAIYAGGTEDDEPQPSDIVWLDIKEQNGIEDGIELNVADKKVTGVTYHDISGRRIATPRNGIYVKTITYSDGSTRTVKSLVK